MAAIQWGTVGEWVAGIGTISAVWFAARISSKERERADLKQESDGLDACSEWLAKLWTRLSRGETISVVNEDYGATVVRSLVDHHGDLLDDGAETFLVRWFTGQQSWTTAQLDDISAIRRKVESHRKSIEARRLAKADPLRWLRTLAGLPQALLARARRAASGPTPQDQS